MALLRPLVSLLPRGTLVACLAGVVLLSVLWFLVAAPAIQQSIPASSALLSGSVAERVTLQLALDRYAALAKNMTARIQTAEQLLAQLRNERSSYGPSLRKKRKDSDDLEEEEAWGDDDEQETDEQRQARQKEEEKEQLQLIGYNEHNKSFRRYRPDFRCGNRVPVLPDNEVVECEPSGEAPCCSANGWCGKSKQHCSCDMCADYRSLAKIKLLGIELMAPQRECEHIAYNFGRQKSPEDCAVLVLPHVECGRKFMISESYPDWGCRCCAASSGPSEAVKPEWKVYSLKVRVESISEGGPTASPAPEESSSSAASSASSKASKKAKNPNKGR